MREHTCISEHPSCFTHCFQCVILHNVYKVIHRSILSMMSSTNRKHVQFSHYALAKKAGKVTGYFFIVLSTFAGTALASPVSTTYLTDATRGQPDDVARCIIAAVHYVSNGTNYEKIRWPQDRPEDIRTKSYYHDESQVTEITIAAEGHVRDFRITDTYEPVTVSCFQVDNRILKLKISPANPQ